MEKWFHGLNTDPPLLHRRPIRPGTGFLSGNLLYKAMRPFPSEKLDCLPPPDDF